MRLFNYVPSFRSLLLRSTILLSMAVISGSEIKSFATDVYVDFNLRDYKYDTDIVTNAMEHLHSALKKRILFDLFFNISYKDNSTGVMKPVPLLFHYLNKTSFRGKMEVFNDWFYEHNVPLLLRMTASQFDKYYIDASRPDIRVQIDHEWNWDLEEPEKSEEPQEASPQPQTEETVERLPNISITPFVQWLEKAKTKAAGFFNASHNLDAVVIVNSLLRKEDEPPVKIPFYAYAKSVHYKDEASLVQNPNFTRVDGGFEEIAEALASKIEILLHTCKCSSWVKDDECMYHAEPKWQWCPYLKCGQYHHCAEKPSVDPRYAKYCTSDRYAWFTYGFTPKCPNNSDCDRECKNAPKTNFACNATCGRKGKRLVTVDFSYPYTCCFERFYRDTNRWYEDCDGEPCRRDPSRSIAIGVSFLVVSIVLIAVVVGLIVYFVVVKPRRIRMQEMLEDEEDEEACELDKSKMKSKLLVGGSVGKSPIAKVVSSKSPISSVQSSKSAAPSKTAPKVISLQQPVTKKR